MAQKENKRCSIVFYNDLRKCQKSFREKMLKMEQKHSTQICQNQRTVLLKNVKNKFFPIFRDISF